MLRYHHTGKQNYTTTYLYTTTFFGFPGGSEVKASACNAGDLGSIPGSGRYPGEGNGNPLQYSCLKNPHGQRSLAGLQSIESDRVQRVRTMIQSMEFSRPEYWSG